MEGKGQGIRGRAGHVCKVGSCERGWRGGAGGVVTWQAAGMVGEGLKVARTQMVKDHLFTLIL